MGTFVMTRIAFLLAGKLDPKPRKFAISAKFVVAAKKAPNKVRLTLTLSTPWMQAHLGTIVCKFGRNPDICLREEAIFVIGTKVPLSRDL